MSRGFVPPHPPRDVKPALPWSGLFGERARTAVYGWSEKAFTEPHIRREVFGFTVHIPLDPDAIQRVFQTNAANYAKPDIAKRLAGPLIGRGLLMADGGLWRKQRRIVAANFTPPAVDGLIPAFAGAAQDEAAGWAPGERDMAAAATRATMRIIADTLFGGDPRLKTPEAMRHIANALAAGGAARVSAILRLPDIGWSPTLRRGRKGQLFLRKTLADLVRERAAGEPQDDFLGSLIAALTQQFGRDEGLQLAVDNAATFYLAGHETTANAVSWALFLLSEQPVWQDRAAAEAAAALAEGGDDADLPERLPLLRQVLDETLRLYPSAPRFDRQAIEADALGEHAIAPGDIISIWPWLLHRHKSLWDDPDAFDPERFGPGGEKQRHRFQYFPFGGGPRTCVGAHFARVEALAILAYWLAGWRFTPVPGHEVETSGSVTLRPKDGLPLRIEHRD
ncbi:MAG: cytochrome P450 [Parasphingopyxis sp.]|nr:cytochrome P450 [Sphingomonadales bacterium]